MPVKVASLPTSFEQALSTLPRTSMARLAARLRAGLVSLCRPLLCAKCGEKWSLFARRSDKQLPLGALCDDCQVVISSDRRLKDTVPCTSSEDELDVVSTTVEVKPDLIVKRPTKPRKRSASTANIACDEVVRPRLHSEPILTPAYRTLSPPIRLLPDNMRIEEDEEYLRKHARYEQKEKTCNLLRPGVYTSLIARYQTRQKSTIVSKRHWGV